MKLTMFVYALPLLFWYEKYLSLNDFPFEAGEKQVDSWFEGDNLIQASGKCFLLCRLFHFDFMHKIWGCGVLCHSYSSGEKSDRGISAFVDLFIAELGI